jgi:PAS domain-containing protein
VPIIYSLPSATYKPAFTIFLESGMADMDNERARIMLDAAPFCVSFLDKNLKVIDCNKQTLKVFDLNSKKEFIDKFPKLSPPRQSDGKKSFDKAAEYVKRAFTEGSCRFAWMHQNLRGEPIPCEITLKRIEYNDDFVLFAYTRDLRSLNTVVMQMHESKQTIDILKNVLDGLDVMVYVTIPDTGEILFINDSMKKHYGIDRDVIGEICYKVLQKGVSQRCEFCPCLRLDKKPNSTIVWKEHSKLTKHIYRNTDKYINWPDGRVAHIQYSADITELILTKNFVLKPMNIRLLNTELNKFIRSKRPMEAVARSIQMAFEVDVKKAISIFEATLNNIANASSEELRLFAIKVQTMKNDLANMGEWTAFRQATSFEKVVKEKNKDAIQKETQKFIKTLKAIVSKIDIEADIEAEADSDPAYLREQLQIISEACACYDEQAATDAVENLEKMPWTKETKAIIDKISEHLLHSDFEEAEALAKKY